MGRRTLIVDAGPLYALFDTDDEGHPACRELLETYAGPLIVPQLVVAEVAYLLRTRLGTRPEAQLLGDLAAGVYTTEPVAAGDWLRMAELVVQYRDFPLGTVDASVVAGAERLGETTIATLDRRHFSVVRPAHAERFELLP